ncbi:MAG TPA: DUF169 domain-containing protein [Stellaceae bacterium]|nr:DUF169 domain-containing protein [Stellaceae bacterium]
MASQNFADASNELRDLLGLSVPPIAIAFAAEAPANVAPLAAAYPAPTADGRTGAVPAGCVFWMHATEKEFATSAADHRNCSVGSYTHGFISLEEAAGHADVEALLAAQWVTPEAAGKIPAVSQSPRSVVYGPLANTSVAPDIVFLRVNGKQLMLLHDAWPQLRFEGKPQCHIIPIAKETGEIAVSSGCMLSRVRTGMSNNEVTCAIPARRLGELIDKLKAASKADIAVAAYAAADSKRFSRA